MFFVYDMGLLEITEMEHWLDWLALLFVGFI